jgi:hypothetical protein
MWAFIYQYALAYFDLLDEKRFRMSCAKAIKFGDLLICTVDGLEKSKNPKNLFSKCVLDFNFAPIQWSVFFIF